MKIETKYLGTVEITPSDIVYFPQGIPGFPDINEFVLLNLVDNELFLVLQAVEQNDLAFIVTSPYHFYQDYSFDLDDHTIELLELASEKDVVVYTILTLKEPFNHSTINLQAPIIINQAKQRAKQFITNEKKFLTKAPITPVAEQGAE